MKKVFLFSMLIIALMSFVIPVSAQDIKKGDIATVPNWGWIDVMNPGLIQKNFSDALIGYGDTCGIEYEGIITVVGINNDRLLVRYAAPGNPTGTPCPTGAIFFVTKEEFSRMTPKYKATQKAQSEELALIEKLLKNE